MNDSVILSGNRGWRKALGAAGSTSAFSVLTEQVYPTDSGNIVVNTQDPNTPIGPDRSPISVTGTFRLTADDRAVDSIIVVRPYGSDTDDETYSLRIWGWNKYDTLIPFQNVNNTSVKGGFVFVPTLLSQVLCTLGTAIPSSRIESGMLWVDTIARTYGDSGINIVSPGTDGLNNVNASFMIDMRGSQFVTFDFALNGGSAVSMNALWKTLS